MAQYFIFSTNIDFIDFVEMHLINKLGVGKANVHDLIDSKSLNVTPEDIIIADDEHQNDAFPICKAVFKIEFMENLLIKEEDYQKLNDFVKKQAG